MQLHHLQLSDSLWRIFKTVVNKTTLLIFALPPGFRIKSVMCSWKIDNALLEKERVSKIEDFMKQYPNANIIWDEAPIGGPEGISPSDVKALAKKISPKSIFWIACNHNQPKKEDLWPGNWLSCGAIVHSNDNLKTAAYLISYFDDVTQTRSKATVTIST